MNDTIYRILLDLFMVSDPWPLDSQGHALLELELDTEARKRGYDNWVVAYHELPR